MKSKNEMKCEKMKRNVMSFGMGVERKDSEMKEKR
jgi:hypothetical protein